MLFACDFADRMGVHPKDGVVVQVLFGGWRRGARVSPANVIKKLLNRININVWRLKFCAFDNFRLAKS